MEIKITKWRSRRYITIVGFEKICPICLQEKKLYAHHIVPLRTNMVESPIRNLIVRICSQCHKLIHPENEIILSMGRFDKELSRVVNYYQKSKK